MTPKIRIRLKAYDHRLLDQSAGEIVDTAKRTGRQGRRPHPAADQDQQVTRAALAARRQEVARAVRDPHAQAPARHPRADAADPRRPDEAGPVGRRRRRDQDLNEQAEASLMQIDIVNIAGKKVGQVDLDDAVFAAEVKEHLLWEVVKAQRAAARAGTHKTKKRDEVRGGGKKPYKQKGTGHARQGSTRSPQFVGGGKVFGPAAARLRVHGAEEGEAGRARVARCRCARRRRSWSSSTRSRSTPPRPRRCAGILKTLGRREGRRRRREGQRQPVEVGAQPAFAPRSSRPRASTSTTSSTTRAS